jgi:hypothetical protein
MASKCDIIRDVARATGCGMCAAIQKGEPVPPGCAPPPPAAVCGVAAAANARMALFDLKYSPANLFAGSAGRAARTQAAKNYEAEIQLAEGELAEAYGLPPGSPAAAVGWPDLEECLWHRDGTGGGLLNRTYFGRYDAQQLGFVPTYPLGGSFGEGSIWPPSDQEQSPLPLTVDYVMNPDLFAVLVFAFLVVLLGVLLWLAWRNTQRAPILAEKARLSTLEAEEAGDPYRGTPFPSFLSRADRCLAYVTSMEKQGYDMGAYRQRCGLPPR